MAELASAGASAEECRSSEPLQEMTSVKTANGDVGQAEGGTKSVDDSNAQENTNQEDTTDNGSGIETGDGKNTEGDAKSTEEDGEYYAVFVMNIPLTASEDDVRKHFENEVAVKTLSLVYAPNGKFRGYATIELPNKNAYEGALKLMGSKLDTQYLYVMPHRSMSQDSKDEIKLYKILVSNISKTVSLGEAKKHFYPAGLVRRFVPKVAGKNQKFGSFDADWSAVMKVNKLETFTNILKMDGSLLGDQAIKIEPLVADVEGVYKRLSETEPSNIKKEKLSDSDQKLSDSEDQENDEDLFKLFVGNLSHTVNSKHVIEHLSQAGTVVSCWMPDEFSTRKRPKIAFVTMADEDGYKKALELSGSKLEENELRINPFVKGKMKEGRIIADPDWLKKPHVVVLSNIPLKTTEADLKKHFESVGEIVCVRFPKDKTVRAAYMELGNEDSYEKAVNMSNTFLGEHCISVMPTTSKLVPKLWLDMDAQRGKAKKKTPAKKGKKGKGILRARDLKRRARRLKRKLERNAVVESMYNPPTKKMKGNQKNQRRGGMNLAAYDHYVTSYGYGGGFFNDGWNNDYRSSSFKRPSAVLQEAKRKEIEQVALAALTELEARKSGMNNYYGSSNNAYGSNTYGSGSNYGSSNTYGSNYSYGSSNSYGSNSSSYYY